MFPLNVRNGDWKEVILYCYLATIKMLQFCRKKKKKNSSEKLSLKELLESCFTIKISFIQTQVYHKSMTKSDVTQILSLLLMSLLKVCITLLGKLQKCVKLQLFPYDKSSKVVD